MSEDSRMQRFGAWFREQFSYLRTRWRVLLHDAVAVAASWLLAYWFRYNLGVIPEPLLEGAVSYLPLVVAVHLFAFLLFGVPRGLWRFISVP
ncbi:MAG: polysaccharide biosynthesis protein, partial [Pseudomonadota bacterium]|nr:polysaccharide biosynthesis protein [Pseudomonadota bacterium]